MAQTYSYCADIGFNQTISDYSAHSGFDEMPENFRTHEFAISTFKPFEKYVDEFGCSRWFYCAYLFPQCEEGKTIQLPCRKYCEGKYN